MFGLLLWVMSELLLWDLQICLQVKGDLLYLLLHPAPVTTMGGYFLDRVETGIAVSGARSRILIFKKQDLTPRMGGGYYVTKK
jgi:hypothetical protein